MSGAAIKNPIIKPPVGLKILARPEAPPEKTGKPINPIMIYNDTVTKACFGVKISAIKLMIIVCVVIITGDNGNGNET